MWCCTGSQCDILYTQQALEDLGYDTGAAGDLAFIQCYSSEPTAEYGPGADLLLEPSAANPGPAAALIASWMLLQVLVLVFPALPLLP